MREFKENQAIFRLLLTVPFGIRSTKEIIFRDTVCWRSFRIYSLVTFPPLLFFAAKAKCPRNTSQEQVQVQLLVVLAGLLRHQDVVGDPPLGWGHVRVPPPPGVPQQDHQQGAIRHGEEDGMTTPVVLDLELFEFFHWVAQNQCSIYLTLLLIVNIFSMLHKSGNYLRARGWV